MSSTKRWFNLCSLDLREKPQECTKNGQKLPLNTLTIATKQKHLKLGYPRRQGLLPTV